MINIASRSLAAIGGLTLLASATLSPMAEAGDRHRHRHHDRHYHGHGSVHIDGGDIAIGAGIIGALFMGEAYRRHRSVEVSEREAIERERRYQEYKRERDARERQYRYDEPSRYDDDPYRYEQAPQQYQPQPQPQHQPQYEQPQYDDRSYDRDYDTSQPHRPLDYRDYQTESEAERRSKYDPRDIRHPDNVAARAEQERRYAEQDARESAQDARESTRDAAEQADNPIIIEMDNGQRIHQPRIRGHRATVQQWSEIENRWIDIREYPSVY